MNINYSPGANLLRGMRAQDDFSYLIRETPLITDGANTIETFQDSSVNHIIAPITANNFALDVYDSTLMPGHEFINLTPSIITCDAQGNVARTVDGTGTVEIKTPVGRRRYSRVMTNTGGEDARYWQSYLSGSLGAHIVSNMVALTSGKTEGYGTTDLFTYNNYSLTDPVAVRNPSLFAAGIDLSAISIINKNYTDDTAVYVHPGLLISPRHIIGAAHFRAVGPIVWMTPGGVYQITNVLGYQNIVNTDIVVQYLSAPVTGINPFAVLPANWRNYMPTADYDLTLNLPCLTKIKHAYNGSERDCLGMNHFQYLATQYGSMWHASIRTDARIAALPTEDWQATVAGGSSGGPLFFVINGQLVIVGTYYTAVSSNTISDHITQIEAAMNSLAQANGDQTVYSLIKADISGFTSFA